MSPPHLPLAAATAATSLGVAISVRLLLLLSRSRALKPLAATTSAAAAALRAPRLLAAASSPLAALLAASKAASKSYKAARALDPAARLPRLPSSKRVKAAFAAASLLRLAAAAPLLAAPSPTAFAALALLKSGYKLSKNSAKVVEGFLGLQVHKGFRNGVDALGVVVKVAVIASEVAVYLSGRFFWGHDGQAGSVRLLRLTRPPGSLVLAVCTPSHDQAQVVLFDPGTAEMDDEGCWPEDHPEEHSELLCLAVPLPERTKKFDHQVSFPVKVVVKVAVIASEVAVYLSGRFFWGRHGQAGSVRLLRLTRPPASLVLAVSVCTPSHDEDQVVLFDPGTAEMDDEGCWPEDHPEERSELLCLAVPLPERTKKLVS